MKNRSSMWFLFLTALAIISAETKAEPVMPEYGLLLTRTGQSAGRSSRRLSYFQFEDPVHSKLIGGTLSQFEPGEDEAVGDDNRLKWKRVEFDDSGAIKERGLYLYAPVRSDERRVAVLDSGSHGEMYVNGEPRAANVYSRNYFHVPVLLNRGTNHLLLRSGRGSFKVWLYDPPAPVFLNKTVPLLYRLAPTKHF